MAPGWATFAFAGLVLQFHAPDVQCSEQSRILAATDAAIRFPIWFVSWQHVGHIKALCPIAAELRRRGWDARVIVHDEMAVKVPKDIPVESAGPLPWNWEQELHFRHSMWDPEPRIATPSQDQREMDERKAMLSEKYFVGSQRSLAEGLNATLHKLPRENWPGLLVIDVSSVGAMDLAEQLGLPFAVVSGWPVGPTLQSIGDESALSHPWLPSELFAFTQAAQQHSFLDRLRRFIFTGLLPRLMEFQGFHEPRRNMRYDWGLSSELQLLQVPKVQPNGERALVIVLSHWGLDRARPLPPNVLMVGPVENYAALAEARPALPPDVLEWMQARPDSQLVYVSFGTNVKPRARMLKELIKGMERLQFVRFLWDGNAEEVEAQIRGDSDTEGSDVDSGHVRTLSEEVTLPENILFAPRVDQLAVLASGKVDAFISHCGLNSVHEAMHFGVPIVGLPFLGDQLITSYLLEDAGAGVRLSVPRLSAYALEESVRKILSNPNHRKHADRLGQLGRVAGGVVAAANALETIARHGTSHFQMILDSHVGSECLWDVYLALLILIIFLLGLLTLCIASFSSSGANSGKEKRG